jgi:molecular chaperone GrpE
VTAKGAAQPDRPDETAPPSDGGAASTGPATDARIDAGPTAVPDGTGDPSAAPGGTGKTHGPAAGSNGAAERAANGDVADAGISGAAAGDAAGGDTTIDLEVTMADTSHGRAGKSAKSAPKSGPDRAAEVVDGAPVDGAKSTDGERGDTVSPDDATGAAAAEGTNAEGTKTDANTDEHNGTEDEDVKQAQAAEDAVVTSADQSGDELDGQSLYAELETLRGDLGELTRDLQRVTAEYANYRKRVERDRTLAGEQATASVLTQLLPALDDLDRARDHGDLVGPFGSVADQLVATLTKFGLTPFGEPGDAFDPTVHEAVSHTSSPDVTETTCIEVMRRGYLLGDRLLRAALVGVADPE